VLEQKLLEALTLNASTVIRKHSKLLLLKSRCIGMDSAKNGFLCLNYDWFQLKIKTKSGRIATFVEIQIIIFLLRSELL